MKYFESFIACYIYFKLLENINFVYLELSEFRVSFYLIKEMQLKDKRKRSNRH